MTRAYIKSCSCCLGLFPSTRDHFAGPSRSRPRTERPEESISLHRHYIQPATIFGVVAESSMIDTHAPAVLMMADIPTVSALFRTAGCCHAEDDRFLFVFCGKITRLGVIQNDHTDRLRPVDCGPSMPGYCCDEAVSRNHELLCQNAACQQYF